KDSENEDFEIIGTTFHKWVREKRELMRLEKSEDFEGFILSEFKTFSNIYLRLRSYASSFTVDYEYVYHNADRGFTLQYQIIMAAISPADTTDIINKKIKLVSCFIDQFIATRVFNFRTVDYSSVRYTVFNLTKKIRRKSLHELLEVFTEHQFLPDLK